MSASTIVTKIYVVGTIMAREIISKKEDHVVRQEAGEETDTETPKTEGVDDDAGDNELI